MEGRLEYEKMGLFYLGGERQDGKLSPLLLKSRELTTHAAIIGMTGSGKTGLGIGLIEEAIMDDVPSIIIDPKGDMANLLLTFPELKPQDFEPWIDPDEAARKSKDVAAYSVDVAGQWKEGLAQWAEDGERIATLRDKTTFSIYTPGSSSGISVSVVDSLAAPSAEVLGDADTISSMVTSVVGGLLALAGKELDTKSREFVLLSTLILSSWNRGEDLNMEALIGAIVQPSFSKIGVFPLDTYYPQKDRMELAMQFNTVIASPAFSAWMCGEPLDIQRILYDDNGRPKTAIFSIAHLGESERMFFVTMLLTRLIAWMRRQQGSSSLKALLYMDEIFGFFPPNGNPPSKEPMLLLLKQARAYGIGVVLATQNPVDLDYKGLGNIGTWCIGRLQTTQDQDRVIDGLAGTGQGLDKGAVRKILSGMKPRTFLMRSSYHDELTLFETRWVMSYLRGPIALPSIARLMEGNTHTLSSPATGTPATPKAPAPAAATDDGTGDLPMLAQGIPQFFAAPAATNETLCFRPWLAAKASVRHYSQKRNIDQMTEVCRRVYLDESALGVDWAEGEENPYTPEELQPHPAKNGRFYALPDAVLHAKNLRGFTRAFSNYLYVNSALELYRAPAVKMESEVGESLADFRVRLADVLREKKEAEVVKLEEQFARKQDQLEVKLQRAAAKVEKEKADVSVKTTDAVFSFGTAILGAFLGRKKISVTTISRASTGMKSVGRLSREKNDVKRAEEQLASLQNDIEALAEELQVQIAMLAEKYSPDKFEIEPFSIKPRRTDIMGIEMYLLWEMVA